MERVCHENYGQLHSSQVLCVRLLHFGIVAN
jgi:hypothetical protein